jgi:hypothetical protein
MSCLWGSGTSSVPALALGPEIIFVHAGSNGEPWWRHRRTGAERSPQAPLGRWRAARPIVQVEGGRSGTRCGCVPTPNGRATAATIAGAIAAAHWAVRAQVGRRPSCVRPARSRPQARRGVGSTRGGSEATRPSGTGTALRTRAERPMPVTLVPKYRQTSQLARCASRTGRDKGGCSPSNPAEMLSWASAHAIGGGFGARPVTARRTLSFTTRSRTGPGRA